MNLDAIKIESVQLERLEKAEKEKMSKIRRSGVCSSTRRDSDNENTSFNLNKSKVNMSIVFYVNLIKSKSLIFVRRLAVMMRSHFIVMVHLLASVFIKQRNKENTRASVYVACTYMNVENFLCPAIVRVVMSKTRVRGTR